MKKWKKLTWVLAALLVLSLGLGACDGNTASNEPLVIGEGDWDSCKFHDYVAKLIIENGYDSTVDIIPASTPLMVAGLSEDDIDIVLELWSDNIKDEYDESIANGDFVEVSTNFDDNMQGLYVPTYLVEGDDALAPDLVTVMDLPKYADLFSDPEEPEKGRIYGAIAGWAADEFLAKKMEAYGLDETYNYMRPGSDAALSASLASSYEKGEPWVGYYWEPTWIIGKYDMTLLEDTEYTPEGFANGEGAFASVKVTVCTSNELKDSNPEIFEFLSNYETSSALTSQALAYMMDNEASHEDAAKWFLMENQDLWKSWVPQDVFDKVMDAIQ